MSIQEQGAGLPGKMASSSEDVNLGGKTHRCRVHTWTTPSAGVHRSVRFIGPEVEKPEEQTFLPEPLVQFWAVENPKNKCDEATRSKARKALEDHFDDAFEAGYQMLSRVHPDGTTVPPRPVFELMKALFRHRTGGAIAVTRRLDSVLEMVRVDPDGAMQPIVPGLDADQYKVNENKTRSKNARICLHRALKAVQAPPSEGTLVQRVRGTVGSWAWNQAEDQQCESSGLRVETTEQQAGRSAADNCWTGGLLRSSEASSQAAVVNAVGGGLLAGEESLWADLETSSKNGPLALRLHTRLLRSVERRHPDDFDTWFIVEREHGFRRLLGRVFEGTDPAVVRAVYRALTWSAMQCMARCYGAFVYRAWVDFVLCHTDGLPTWEAFWLFREQNAPHLAFAGLPLAFLSPGQLLWVWKGLRHLWASGAAAWAKYQPALKQLAAGKQVTTEPLPETPGDLHGLDGTLYDTCTRLLGVYATTAAAVREADRDVKAIKRGSKVRETPSSTITSEDGGEEVVGRQVRGDLLELVEVPSFDLELPLDAPPMEDDFCFKCHERYRVLSRGEEQKNGRVMRVECLCGEHVFKVTDNRAA